MEVSSASIYFVPEVVDRQGIVREIILDLKSRQTLRFDFCLVGRASHRVSLLPRSA